MKNFFFVFFLIPVLAWSQQKEEVVVNLSGKSAVEMYSTAKEWFALSPKPGVVTIQLDDPLRQKIVGKGIKSINYTLLNSPANIDVYYAFSIQFKDGRYKYLLDLNTIKYQEGYEMSYEDFKSLITKDGLDSYCKKNGLKPQFRSKVEVATFNDIYDILNKDFENTLADLTANLKSDKKEENW